MTELHFCMEFMHKSFCQAFVYIHRRAVVHETRLQSTSAEASTSEIEVVKNTPFWNFFFLFLFCLRVKGAVKLYTPKDSTDLKILFGIQVCHLE